MPLVLSNSFHPKTCAASAGTSLLRRGGRAVIPKNIPFNRVRRAEVLQQCDGNAGQLWQYSTSKESLGVQDQSWYHCLTCPALHPLSLPPAPALLTVGRSPGANPSVLQGVEPDGLCLALLNSIILVLVCSTKELLFIDFSSWGLGKKGLRESHLFQGCFESEIMQNIHQGDLRYFCTRAIERSSVLSLVSHQWREEENIYLVQFLA